MRELESVRQLSDQALVLQLDRSVQEDRRTTVRLLAHMGEVDARGLYRDQGFASMFDYAVRKLHMSEPEAALRIRVARLGREFPVALEMLGRGELHLTALNVLAPVLSHANLGLLQRARFQSKQKVLELRAQYAPQPDVPASVRRLPEQRCAQAAVVASASSGSAESAESALKTACTSVVSHGSSLPSADTAAAPTRTVTMGKLASTTAFVRPSTGWSPKAAVSTGLDSGSMHMESGCVASIVSQSAASDIRKPTASDAVPAPMDSRSESLATPVAMPAKFELSMPSPASAVVPLSPARFKVTFTASQRVRDKLEEAQELLRHQLPSRDLGLLFERALDLLIAEHKKRRFAQTDKPRKTPSAAPANAHSRYLASDVRRRVWTRDGGRCCFRGPDGTRCGARSLLEFHHIVPFERGGASTADNIALMCKGHNALLAERDYGREFVRSKISAARRVRADAQRTEAPGRDVAAGDHPACAASEAQPAQNQ